MLIKFIYSIINHSFFFKSSKTWSYLFVSAFFLIFLIFLQTFSGIFLSLGVCNHLFFIKTFHSLGATLIMFFSFIHIYKNLFFKVGSGLNEFSTFFSGGLVFLFLIFICFTGSIAPCGQISYWGTKVITGFFEIIPFLGHRIKYGIWGDKFICESFVFQRFFLMHVLLGCFFLLFLFFHIYFAHSKKSIVYPLTSLEFCQKVSFIFPDTYIKDFSALLCFIFIISIYFYLGDFYFEEDLNKSPVTSEQTPLNMRPSWYFWVSFSSLKYISSKFFGMLLSIFLLVFWIFSIFDCNFILDYCIF